MKIFVLLLSTSLSLFGSQVLLADDRPGHFKGKPSENLDQAMQNLAEYNQKLKTVLSNKLTPQAMAEIHQLTYTLENALNKIDSEIEQIKETLEHVHVGSESMNYDEVKQSGKAYIEQATKLVKP